MYEMQLKGAILKFLKDETIKKWEENFRRIREVNGECRES